ncbi:hypothetical protein OESDEN_01268 [Oesophagostomum dentatum]|uniref:Uncharacterized protein n=1 Tax=Oesophagostomum dentatum TaxID=61180 RepID=A0A0B1TSF5_OESDE|nr:hypothetical protein OESDEN_01268 [Oesophagostomum dentatum]
MPATPHSRFILLGIILAVFACTFADDTDMGTLQWNKAHGLWGKRSSSGELEQDIQKRQNNPPLRTLPNWMQRYAPVSPLSLEWGKRSQWQLANGLWGRRR